MAITFICFGLSNKTNKALDYNYYFGHATTPTLCGTIIHISKLHSSEQRYGDRNRILRQWQVYYTDMSIDLGGRDIGPSPPGLCCPGCSARTTSSTALPAYNQQEEKDTALIAYKHGSLAACVALISDPHLQAAAPCP